jgi:hypothetical protein
MAGCDVLISGTGGFAARIAFDIAATAEEPVETVISGRNRERLNWLRTAANARPALFGRRARFRTPRVWLDGNEVEDVCGRFADIQLTPEPVIEISGASGVPVLLAMTAGRPWRGHAPGPSLRLPASRSA